MNRERWIVKGFEIALVLTIVIAGFGSATWQLWNWLMPSVFGLHSLTFWEAVGLMGLSWILFGGLRGFGGFSLPRRHSTTERWAQMTPEERERFRKGLNRPYAYYRKPAIPPQ
jgi:hypothetical protein